MEKISHLSMFPRTSFAVGKIRDSIKESKKFHSGKILRGIKANYLFTE